MLPLTYTKGVIVGNNRILYIDKERHNYAHRANKIKERLIVYIFNYYYVTSTIKAIIITREISYYKICLEEDILNLYKELN